MNLFKNYLYDKQKSLLYIIYCINGGKKKKKKISENQFGGVFIYLLRTFYQVGALSDKNLEKFVNFKKNIEECYK